ncbi:imidazole glycerol phosphate synthase subunit HisH [Brevibacterium luteolum]|uniref:imidazole glycerol phosphate synthase subunit HisH n=1 Tax=Brevibacterium luteolum TaxID=199591 RepID=UPI001C24F5C8|nr:imidazole glycerol phosphate synthase subunit HisH [Brevibacterium luteolum]MBU8579861.1 imidazole glycerol phosphate synthase subunit HisH [Brevibacterium luteolum]
MSADIVVLDYGAGNVHSALRAVERAGADAELTGDLDRVAAADGLLVPGVGAFGAVMDALESAGAVEVIRTRHREQRPMLGICVGMQVLYTSGTEHGLTTAGIGLWEGNVTRLDAPVLPHMGWNTVTASPGSQMFAGIADERFYFVHTYAATEAPAAAAVTTCTLDSPFIAAVEDGTTWATQFHPEKSGHAGTALLANWIQALSAAQK